MARPLLRGDERPTWVLLAACYATWLAATAGLAAGSEIVAVLCVVPAILATALHASLQHEALHGHPTRSALLNEALVFPAPGLLYPYRRFREMHLRHHDDARLTDPYDDPESWYLAEADARALAGPLRWALEANRTLLGRMVLGPWLGAAGLATADLRALRAGAPRIAGAWARHAAGVGLVLAWLVASGVNPVLYALAVAWPAASLIYVRTFIEHRAAEAPGHRTAVVEAGWFWSLMFLNNNLHAVHHAEPNLPWHRLPERWRARREAVLARNGGHRVPGYGVVFRRWLLAPREPLVHPFRRREPPPAS